MAISLAVVDDAIESLVDVITTYRTGKALSDEQLVRTAKALAAYRSERYGTSAGVPWSPAGPVTTNLSPGFVSLTPPHRRSMGRSGTPPRRR
jgi:hypothetical protein